MYAGNTGVYRKHQCMQDVCIIQEVLMYKQEVLMYAGSCMQEVCI